MDETTVLTVSSFGVEHAIISAEALTSEEYVRNFVSLAKSQGYCLSNIEESLAAVLDEVRDEIRLIKRV